MTMCPVGLNTPSDVENLSFVSLFKPVLPPMKVYERARFFLFYASLDLLSVVFALAHLVAAHGTRNSLSVLLQTSANPIGYQCGNEFIDRRTSRSLGCPALSASEAAETIQLRRFFHRRAIGTAIFAGRSHTRTDWMCTLVGFRSRHLESSPIGLRTSGPSTILD